MRALLQRVTATITAHEMLAPGQTVLVAFSGGADSTALLHALHSLGYRVTAAHVHHGLRGEEADADAEHAAAVAASLGVPFVVQRAEVRPVAEEQGLSLETAAREVRYRLLEEMRAEAGAERIATGHTADDQAETVLLNLLRGAGPAGLSGIPPVRGNVIRPLLGVARAEARAYCDAVGLAYRVDRSNEDRRFTRNRIRHELLPALAGVQPNVTEVLTRLADIMREENAFLTSLVEQMLRTIVAWGEEEAHLPLHDLHSLPAALQRRLWRGVIAIAQGRETDIEYERIEALVALAEHGQTGAVIELPGGLQAERTYGEIVVSRAHEHPVIEGEWTLPVPGAVTIRELGVTLRAEESADTGLGGGSEAVLDADTVTGPLMVRMWRAGDRFTPLGMTEAVKLQDFFVNAKVPRVERHRTPLVVAGEEIVWVVGFRVSEHHKVTPDTCRTIRLQVEPQ